MIIDLEKKAASIRGLALSAMYKAKIGHTADSLSLVEILVSLYYGEILGKPALKFDKENPGGLEKDYLFLSNPNTVAVLYAILADLGFFEEEELDYFGTITSSLAPFSLAKVPGVNFTSLNFGEALGVAIGTALDLKKEKSNNRCYCLLSDQELQIGSVWEAAVAAASYNLDNLTVFVDNNRMQSNGPIITTNDVKSIQDKFEGCGWKVFQVTDGHNFDQILEVLEKSRGILRRPICIWCRTTSGKGLPFAERKSGFNKYLTKEEFTNAQMIFN